MLFVIPKELPFTPADIRINLWKQSQENVCAISINKISVAEKGRAKPRGAISTLLSAAESATDGLKGLLSSIFLIEDYNIVVRLDNT